MTNASALSLDPKTRTISRGDRSAKLTDQQFIIAERLVQSPASIVPYDALVRAGRCRSEVSMKVQVNRIRRAVEPLGVWVRPVANHGYRLYVVSLSEVCNA